MMELLDEIDAVLAAGHERAALLLAFVVPDHAAALADIKGETSGGKYAAWFDAHMQGGYLDPWKRGQLAGQPVLTGAECWQFRCALLHQSVGTHRTTNKRISFSDSTHLSFINGVLVLGLHPFVSDMTRSARAWLTVAGKQEWIVYRNLKSRIQLVEGGGFGGIKYGNRVFL